MTTRSTAFTFGTLLAIYLFGSAAGCLLGARWAPRLGRPLRVFLLCQCGLLLYSGLAVLALVALPPTTPGLSWYHEYWRSGAVFHLGDTWDPGLVARLYLALPLALFGPPTVLMGLSFPALQRAVQDDPATCGRKVGLLQAANIAGCVVGSLAVGLAGLTWLGTSGSLRLLLVAGVGFAAVGLREYGPRSPFAPLAVLLLLVAAALPGRDRLWLRLHGASSSLAMAAEDATSVGAILPWTDGWHVVVNGKHHSRLPFGGVHTRLGAIPALVHPSPVDVAIIGLGSGDTAWAALCRSETRSLTVFEIAGPQRALLTRVAERDGLPELRSLLRDPRLTVRLDDGRHALAHGEERYDVIEADALWPYAAYSGNLYSGRVLPGVRGTARAGRSHVHVGAHAESRGVLPRGLPARGGAGHPCFPPGQQRADPDRARRLAREARVFRGGVPPGGGADGGHSPRPGEDPRHRGQPGGGRRPQPRPLPARRVPRAVRGTRGQGAAPTTRVWPGSTGATAGCRGTKT